MASQQAPQQKAKIADADGMCTRPWYLFFTTLGNDFTLGTYATAPMAPTTGQRRVFTDSPVAGWGDVVSAGGGSNTVLAWWNGAAWTVIGA